MHQPLAEEGLLIRRHEESIDEDIIDKVRTHRAGIADIAHLDGYQAVGEDGGSGVLRIAREVDQYVDGVGLDKFGSPSIRGLADIDKAIKGADKAGPCLALVVGTAGVADDLEILERVFE